VHAYLIKAKMCDIGNDIGMACVMVIMARLGHVNWESLGYMVHYRGVQERWGEVVNSGRNSGCTFNSNYVITICEMQWSHLCLNLAKFLHRSDLNNVWHLLVALV
jgi:hypothetical protein